jgi:hypothetical protein
MMGCMDDSDNNWYNVCNYTYNGVRGHHNDVHGNLIQHIVLEGWPNADHANGIFIFGPTGSNTALWVYNNVINDDSAAPGSEIFWLDGLIDCSNCVTYAYNNVLYNVGRGIDVGGHPPNNTGTYNLYNNTIQNSSGQCFGNGESPARSTLNYANNHCIISSGSICNGTGTTCNNLGNNLQQTPTVASQNVTSHFDQYNSSTNPVYAPQAATNSTVGAGQNLSSNCSGNVAALCSDTTYATENTSNHTVVLRTTNGRGSTWDIGTFEYNAQDPQPNPPTGLSAVVN